MRTMLTNLIRYGHLTTTQKKAKVLVAYADSFFARLVRINTTLDKEQAQRESIRYVKSIVYGKENWHKVLREILPELLTKKTNSWFFTAVKLGKRQWDAAELIKIEFVQ